MTSILVQAIDGFFYKDPAVVVDQGFISFSEEEPPEIVVKAFRNTSMWSAKTRSAVALRSKGIKYRWVKDREMIWCKRLFPPNWEHMEESCSFFFNLLAPIPVPEHHSGAFDIPSSECVFMAFAMSFDTETVVKFFHDDPVPDLLLAIVLGESPYKAGLLRSKRKVKNEILRQYPGFNTLDFAQAIEKHGLTMSLKRIGA